ncbi:hypothetical protein Tco_1348849 [Tanacetum coccineum]
MIRLISEHLNLLLTEIVTLDSDEGTPGLLDMRVAQDDLPTEMSGREQYQRRDEMKKIRLDHLKQDQEMLVIKIFSERKKVFRERKKYEKIRAKRSDFLPAIEQYL